VATKQPIYKWYHFIGTHVPAQWDAECVFQGRQPQSREFYKAQTHCILKGMANLIIKLKQEKIYNNTTIIVNGDHGCNIPANDLFAQSKNTSTYTDNFLGVTRPLFMLKKPNNNQPLFFSNSPTTLEDVVPTIFDVANISSDKYKGVSAFKKSNDGENTRIFHRYISNTFWTGEPVAFNEYHVSGNIKNRSNWSLVALNNRPKAPSSYERMAYPTAYMYSKGLSLSKSKSKTQMNALVHGSEFFILVSDIEDKATTISIKLRPHKKSYNLQLSLKINNQQVVNNRAIDRDNEKWMTLNIPLSDITLKPENNLFEFEFIDSNAHKDTLIKSAIIKSLHLKSTIPYENS
jgi:hypothetical protein